MRLYRSIFKILFCLTMLLSFYLALLHSGSLSASELTLAWDANLEGDLAGYKIYYLTASPNGWLKGTGLAQGASPVIIPLDAMKTSVSPSYQLSGLKAGESYHFAVTAYNSNGIESDFSNLVRYDVPAPVANSSNAPTSDQTGASLSWAVTVSEGSSLSLDSATIGPLEVGEVNVNSRWLLVSFSRAFAHPVVVASAMSSNDDEPAIVRIDNITSTGFEISVQEWDYLDDDHLHETIGYIVMEAGSYTLPDGTTVEAGTFTADGTSAFTPVLLAGKFTRVPVVASSVVSYNGQNAVSVRLQNITATRFEARMHEQQANGWNHPAETVSYIAWEPCRTRLGGLLIEVAVPENRMAHDFETITFDTIFQEQPLFVAAIQTNEGGDTAALRWKERSASSIQVKVEEEQSFDSETLHAFEAVGFFTFAPENLPDVD